MRIDQEAMNGVLRKIKGSNVSIVKFVSEAIKKEVKELDEQNNAIYLKEINDHYNERLDHYARLGINSFEEFVSRMASNTDEIIELKKRVKDFDDLSMMVGGKFHTLPIIIEKTKTGKKWRLATKEEIKQSEKLKRSKKAK